MNHDQYNQCPIHYFVRMQRGYHCTGAILFVLILIKTSGDYQIVLRKKTSNPREMNRTEQKVCLAATLTRVLLIVTNVMTTELSSVFQITWQQNFIILLNLRGI